MKETSIPRLSDEKKKRIKEIVNFHYGFLPKDNDIDSIDNMLRNNYSALHQQQIIRELVIQQVDKEILKYQDKIGSIKFETIWHEKSIFKYLTYASMCYKSGIPIATISLCRTAIESGLREKVAEELILKEGKDIQKLPETIWNKIEIISKDKGLEELIKEAERLKIIRKSEIEELFEKFKSGNRDSRNILDKFIHGDIVWIVNFVKSNETDTTVIGAKNKLEENKIVSDLKTDKIAVEVLKSTQKIAGILYYKNI